MTRSIPVLIASLLMAAGLASAQPMRGQSQCATHGASPLEPLSDRPQHSIQVSHYTCTVQAGAMQGGVATGVNVWEWDGPRATLLSGHSVVRKGASVVVQQQTEGSVQLELRDGQVVGFTSLTKGVGRLGSGDGAVFKGKAYSSTARATGPGQFSVEVNWAE